MKLAAAAAEAANTSSRRHTAAPSLADAASFGTRADRHSTEYSLCRISARADVTAVSARCDTVNSRRYLLTACESWTCEYALLHGWFLVTVTTADAGRKQVSKPLANMSGREKIGIIIQRLWCRNYDVVFSRFEVGQLRSLNRSFFNSRARDVMSSNDDAVVMRHVVTSSRDRVIVTDECHRSVRLLPAYRSHRRRRQISDDHGKSLTSHDLSHVSDVYAIYM